LKIILILLNLTLKFITSYIQSAVF